MIDLLKVFKDCPEYAIMKIRGTFPEYEHGQDVDIACRDLSDTTRYLSKYFRMTHPVRINYRSPSHVHFDVMDSNDEINLRFDLYSEFISPKFTEDILDYKMKVKYGYGFGDTDIWIADYHRDILIKCWEYHTNGKQQYKDYAKFKEGLDVYLKQDD
ncbi:MAG TPA: hypothetical protein ENH82_08670 [bacterium]|nr:hypothetical protein [bacterium]